MFGIRSLSPAVGLVSQKWGTNQVTGKIDPVPYISLKPSVETLFQEIVKFTRDHTSVKS